MSRAGPPVTEHPLLGLPKRDAWVTSAFAVVTAAFFVLVADRGTFVHIQRVDDHFLRTMLSIRSAPLTAVAKVLNMLGLTYVTLAVRVVIAAFLAWRRRWWHLAAFGSAVLASEILIGPVKRLYDRRGPTGP